MVEFTVHRSTVSGWFCRCSFLFNDDHVLQLSSATVSRWDNRFCGVCVKTDNEPRPGRWRTSTDERSVKLVADALEENRRTTCEELSRATGVSATSEFRIVTNDLCMRKFS